MYGLVCHWEYIVFSPVSGVGEKGKNKFSLFFLNMSLCVFCDSVTTVRPANSILQLQLKSSSTAVVVSYLGRMNKETGKPKEIYT